MSPPPVAAVDVGGANLKAAHEDGSTIARPFAVWREPDRLAGELRETLRRLPDFRRLAVTMTAELCDCFETRRDGVLHVLRSVEDAARGIGGGIEPLVWRIDGRFVTPAEARDDPLPAAAANWLALATFAARLVPASGVALVADMGSTTVDIVAVVDGRPAPRGLTDTDRLAARELVYTGLRRTPIAAVVDALPHRGRSCPVIAELFATTEDVHVLLGDVPEDATSRDTADGRPRTASRSRERLARMIGADRETFDDNDALIAARAVADAQEARIAAAVDAVISRTGDPSVTVVAGEGEALLRRALGRVLPGREIVSLAARLGPEASRAACAHALIPLVAAR